MVPKTLTLDDRVYRRLASVQGELVEIKKRDLDISQVIDHLIDVYQDTTTLSGEHGGG